MTTDTSRKRKHSESATTSSPQPRFQPAQSSLSESNRNDVHHENLPDAYGTTESHENPTQSYTNTSVSDQAKAHYGNVYYKVTNTNIETGREGTHDGFMKALAFKRMGFRRAAIEPAYAETCQWIFQEESFRRWRDPAFRETNRGLFWIKGKPGSGKSTLMKCILEGLERVHGRTVVSFFFHARGTPLEYSTEGCYRSLLHQMLEQIPKLRTTLRSTHYPSEDQGWEVAVVRDKLREAILQLEQESLVLMIDALDECDVQEVRDMVYFLDSLATSTKFQTARLSICFASRHYPSITIRSCENLVLESANLHEIDIYDYISENLHVEPVTHRHVLQKELMQKSQGVFLWVKLVTRRLNEQFDRGASLEKLLSGLGALPIDLSTLIHRIIIDGASDACLLPIMIWTLVGDARGKVMQPGAFCFAVQFAAGKLTSPHLNQSMVDLEDLNAMMRFVLHSSKGLVELCYISSNDRLIPRTQFIHESVRQHILNGGLAILRPILGYNVKAVSQAIVIEWCHEYLRCDFSSYLDFSVDSLRGIISSNLCDRRQATRAFPIFRYAVQSMLWHIESAYLGGSFDFNRLRAFPLKQWVNAANLLADEGWFFEPTVSFLHIFLEAYLHEDDCALVRGLLELHPMYPNISEARTTGTEVIDQEFSTMLFGASFDTFCGGEYGTPLVAAAEHGLTNIVTTLLELGAGINVCADGNMRHTEPADQVGQRVAELDLDVLSENAYALSGRRSPLIATLESGNEHSPLVELLLGYGAKINISGGTHGNALGSAIYYSLWNIVNLLQNNGADIAMVDSYGCNIAIRQAVETERNLDHSHAQDIQMLIDSGAHAEPAALNIFLHMAARNYWAESPAMEILLRAGADPGCRDVRARTILHNLAEGGNCMAESVWSEDPGISVPKARLALELGVNINAVGGEYDTALIAASTKGDVALVRFLLDNGAHTQHRSDKHGTAIDAARASKPSNGNKPREEIVRMLSEAGSY